MHAHRMISGLILVAMLLIPLSAAAQEHLSIQVDTSVTCDRASFSASVEGGVGPYVLGWDFGDGEALPLPGVTDFPSAVEHTYPGAGEYAWTLSVNDSQSAIADASGMITIDGPAVTLMSDPFPPLLFLDNGGASASFSAQVSGGVEPYTYIFDLDGDGAPDPDDGAGGASFTYTEAGKYLASVVVTDDCGLMSEDTLPVVVIDPDQDACHPMAQRIADAVNTLFPTQAEDLYRCEDIYDIFRGGLTGRQVGFGRMWHAYHLAETIQDLTWEEIRDWHLDGNGWGGLVQLNRFADLLQEHGLRELVDLVVSGEATVRDLRHSVRAVVRYDADFEDALVRIQDGMSPGQLGRYYRTSQDLGVELPELDDHLASGHTLQELSHAARLADRHGVDWQDVAAAHAAGHSWGAIGQAQRLAEGEDWMQVLETGTKEFREQQRSEDRGEREQDRLDRAAEKLARQYGVSEAEVWSLFNGSCGGDWKCVRSELRGK